MAVSFSCSPSSVHPPENKAMTDMWKHVSPFAAAEGVTYRNMKQRNVKRGLLKWKTWNGEIFFYVWFILSKISFVLSQTNRIKFRQSFYHPLSQSLMTRNNHWSGSLWLDLLLGWWDGTPLDTSWAALWNFSASVHWFSRARTSASL